MFLGYLLDVKGHGGKQQQRWQLGGQLAKLNNRIITIKVGVCVRVCVYIIYEISYTNLNFVACAY